MELEEASLRAKIQAMKNLLQVKQQQETTAATSGYMRKMPLYQNSMHKFKNTYNQYYPQHQSIALVHPGAALMNRTWTRQQHDGSIHSSQPTVSTNKVWTREGLTPMKQNVNGKKCGGVSTTTHVSSKKLWPQSSKKATASKPSLRSMLAKRARSRMQLQMLKLEDGEYAKANGGFSLVRAGVKKPTSVAAATTVSKTIPTITRAGKSVTIGGIKYVVAGGGKSLKRLPVGGVVGTSDGSAKAVAKIGGVTPAMRAKAAIQRARITRFKANAVKARTEYCKFYNRFGKFSSTRPSYCNKKNDCKFIHDSRRVAMCPKFLKNECSDPNCSLSHRHDENKMPVCTMFLRGVCTRDDCKYLHVKVSQSAQVCEAFLKGYCPNGAACKLKHERPQKKRRIVDGPNQPDIAAKATTIPSKSGTWSTLSTTQHSSPLPSNTVQQDQQKVSLASTSSTNTSNSNSSEELSLRPNIRFVPKHASGLPSLLSGLRNGNGERAGGSSFLDSSTTSS